MPEENFFLLIINLIFFNKKLPKKLISLGGKVLLCQYNFKDKNLARVTA
jgi:hypothetical protein